MKKSLRNNSEYLSELVQRMNTAGEIGAIALGEIMDGLDLEMGLEPIKNKRQFITSFVGTLGEQSIRITKDSTYTARGKKPLQYKITDVEQAIKNVSNGISITATPLKPVESVKTVNYKKALQKTVKTEAISTLFSKENEHKGAPTETFRPVVFDDMSKTDISYVIYAIACILRQEKHSVSLAQIQKTLRERFGYNLEYKNNLLDIIKGEKEDLEYIQTQQTICFKKQDSFMNLFRKHNPKTMKTVIFARIAMPLDEVLKYVSSAKIVSTISDSDAIYSLEIDRTFNSKTNLMKLFRTFRGTDTIFGNEELVNNLNLQIKIADGLYNKNSAIYSIEKELITK